jgi:hypothetical protein
MIQTKDELLHDAGKKADWGELFSLNFCDRKSKCFGYADIHLQKRSKSGEVFWGVFLGDTVHTYNGTISFDQKASQKSFGNNHLKYKIITPKENFGLEMKNDSLAADFSITGSYPIYVFPAAVGPDIPGSSVREPEYRLWDRYEQRCRFSGSVSVLKGPKKGYARKIECVGQRAHSWGSMPMENFSCWSWVTIQFRDMTMDITYFENGGVPYSNGFISRRTGNIPMQSVEFELVAMGRDGGSFMSSEFSYRDAQDDRDLVVSKKFYSISLPVPKGQKHSHLRVRAFSEFTIIGTNKKGVGMEEHFISLERLRKMY